MSVAVGDYNRDGHVDAFVTNDTVPNFLFQNHGDGTFREIGLLAGVSVPLSGRAISAMGADMQDYDNDGWLDIHVTALTGELFPLFRNDARGAFEETTQASGLAGASAKRSGWCTVFADLDNDGRKDIFTANSHVDDRIADQATTTWKQPNALFLNDGAGRFRDASSEAGIAGASAVHRGCGAADFNGDGRLDLVVTALGSQRRVVAERQRTGSPLADRAVDGHEEQPRRHRRAGDRGRSGANDEHGGRLRVLVPRRAAFRPRRFRRPDPRRGAVAVWRQTGGRQRAGQHVDRDQGAVVRRAAWLPPSGGSVPRARPFSSA